MLLCINDSSVLYKNHPILIFGQEYYSSGEYLNNSGDEFYIIPSLPNSYNPKSKRYNNAPLYIKSRFIKILSHGNNEQKGVLQSISRTGRSS